MSDATATLIARLLAERWLPRDDSAVRQVLVDEGANVFTAEMLMRGAASLPAFDGLAAGADGKTHHFATFFEPPSLDARIVNQYALFSLMSSPNVSLDDWLARHPEMIRKIVIPAEIKWEVRDKLDQANVTERVLFPGLDGLSSWLRRQYTPRNRIPELIRGVKDIAGKYGLVTICYGHAADGNLHCNIIKTVDDATWRDTLPIAITEIFQYTASLGGQVSGEHGVGYVQREYLPITRGVAEIALMKQIKAQFDPLGILNPVKIFV